MSNQNMLALIERLNVAPADIRLFYIYYRHLRFLFSSDQGLKVHSMKGLVVGKFDLCYSFYVDFILLLKGGCSPDVNLNADAKRFSYFEDGMGVKRLFRLVFGQEILFRRYLKGLVGRGRIYDAVHHHGCKNLSDFWLGLSQNSQLKAEVEKVADKLVFAFGRMKVRRVFVVDFSDSLNLLALYAARLSGSKVVTIPHGYIQSFSELYSYGHLSDVYICWSLTEAQRIQDLLGNKVEARYFGCPKYAQEYVSEFSEAWSFEASKRSVKRVVLFCNPIVGKESEVEFKNCIIGLNNFLTDHGVRLDIKLHQRDAIGQMIGFLQGNGVSVVGGAVEEILMHTDLALGFQTTVLSQAAVLNVPSLQLVLDNEVCFKFDLVEQVFWGGGLAGDEILSRLTLEGCTLQNNGLNRAHLRSYIESL
ncbi:MAG: hypothetical protein ACN6P1_07520 [Pseudomonas sp.]|uniref:hypothetical protein n=1 Tax=Pseudomonas sp. TaxID=306 RepID=UPI003D102BB3